MCNQGNSEKCTLTAGSALCQLNGHNPHAHDTTPLGKCNQVAVVKDFFNIIYQSHYKDTGHSGAKKTLAKVRLTDSP